MNMRVVLALLIVFFISACGGSSSSDSDDGGVDADDTGGDTAGDTGGDTAGDTGGGTAGDTGGGTAGDTGGDVGGDTGANDTGGDTGGADTGGGTGGSFSGNVLFLGLVFVDEDVPENEVSAGGTFIRYTSEIAANLFEPVFAPQLDVCTVDSIDISDVNTDFPDIDTDVVPELVSAGEVVPLTSAAGTFIQLQRQDLFGFLVYVPEPESVSGAIPSQLTLDIPGDVFPMFPNVNVPTVQTLALSSPAQGQPITPETVFTWTPGSNPEAHISITASTFDGTGTTIIVQCEVVDDGQFAFPTATQSAMGSSFSSFSADVTREVLVFEQQGNAILVLTTSSGN